ncbi:alpha/beta hydrolase [Pseudoroseomonas globiformis]|uniref:Alpha/beta hydrolase n=1 Tax=Teichococcus globiformis TaxID=2307229 RepID=A0ABV7G170_9PROT
MLCYPAEDAATISGPPLRFLAPAEADAPALLFLHGAGCGAWVWDEGFGARCAAHGLDGTAPLLTRHRGATGLSVLDYVAEARALLAGLKRDVVLVGHSLGALVAQHLLLEPAVRGAVLLTPVPPEGLWLSSAQLAWTDPVLWAEAARMDAATGSAPAALAPTLFGPSMPAAAAQQFLARMGGESQAALLEAQFPQPVPMGWLHGRKLLVLGAAEDRLISPDAARRCALWHGAELEILPDRGHLLMLEPGWEAVADRVIAWVRKLG